jgi:microsomal dipeptidase-like Zn-dependent dipeptidase/anthranilate/para-aminobenzoate synthase component II
MKQFNLQAFVDGVYAQFPAAGQRPVIGITGNYADLCCTLGKGYYQSVINAGGVPVIIPPSADHEVLMNTLDHIDGLILSGGADINPLWAGEEPVSGLHGINSERDLPELLITRLAYNRQLPMLGICRGIQTLAMALGGKVCQDITSDIKHSQDADRSEPTHSVNVIEGSTLYNIYKDCFSPLTSHPSPLFVNSFHHQAVSEAGDKFRVVATSPDGIIEAIESTEFKSILGVQWHPECMGDSGQPLFQWLISEAQAYRKAHEVHNRVLTLDTHCDTPMFFPQGIHFEQRDPRILVDLHKMTEGRQDATIMVAYLPQPKYGEPFAKNVAFDVEGPTQYADLIFDKIEDIVKQNQQYLSIARTPADLWENKQQGRKSIMLGIENGLALNGEIQNIKHFADRGIVYITLCHNGDNDICDSARGSNTHDGVSAFGQQVIQEMNRLGLMVDLSHAAEKSFYDALDISQTPIVCSHSSCRALCDHPRNLTDDQMRRLAAAGGVMQVTLYNGFLVRDGEASILDAFAHLEHAIKVMGIDHVGLGTDFDGDGGIRGLCDSSELLQFTRQLLARRYSEQDIQKIWGGNFLRVMQQVQQSR